MTTTLSPGQSGTLLDIYIKAGTVLYDPTSVVFTITDANAALQGSGTYYGYKLSTGHYDARNFIVTSSGTAGSWTITWAVAGTSKQEVFTVEAPTLSTDGVMPNSIDRIIDNIRIDIGDFDGSIFELPLLERYITKSVMRLNRELGISTKVRPTGITAGGLGSPARIPQITFDADARTIYPDNDEIKDIITLQAEVLITRAEMSVLRRASAAGSAVAGAELLSATSGMPSNGGGEGVYVQNADGVIINTTSRYGTWMSNKTKLFLEEQKAREAELEKAIKQLKYSFSSSQGKVIY
jgi:hypothetical protein